MAKWSTRQMIQVLFQCLTFTSLIFFLSCKKDFETDVNTSDFLPPIDTLSLSSRTVEWKDFGGVDIVDDQDSLLIASLNRESQETVNNGMIEDNNQRDTYYVLRLSILKQGKIQRYILKEKKTIFYKVGIKSETNFIRTYINQSKVHVLYLSNNGSLVHIDDVFGENRESILIENIASFAVDQKNPRGIAMSRTNGELIYCQNDGAFLCQKISPNLLATNLDPSLSLFHDHHNRPHIVSNVASGEYDHYERLAYFYYDQNWNEKYVSTERYGHLRASVRQDGDLASICFVSGSTAYGGKIDLRNSHAWAVFSGHAPYSDSKRKVPTCVPLATEGAHYLAYVPAADGKLSYYLDGRHQYPDQGELFIYFNIIYQLRIIGTDLYAVSYNDGQLSLNIYRHWQ